MVESDFNKIKRRIDEQGLFIEKGFSFTRVAKKTKQEFWDYATEEWAGDYGATFTYIWKVFTGLGGVDIIQEIQAKVEILKEEIDRLNQFISEEKEEEIPESKLPRLDGKVPGKNKEE